MDAGTYAVISALVAGTLRAAELWRASIGVDVVNVVVLNALAEGRGRELRALLRGSGSAPYLDVAAAIGESMLALRAESDLGKRLRHDADAAVFAASRRLRRHSWLDYVALASIAFAGIDAVINRSASRFDTVGLVAATVLWFANARGARSIATRAYAGASALVDSLLKSLDQIPEFGRTPGD